MLSLISPLFGKVPIKTMPQRSMCVCVCMHAFWAVFEKDAVIIASLIMAGRLAVLLGGTLPVLRCSGPFHRHCPRTKPWLAEGGIVTWFWKAAKKERVVFTRTGCNFHVAKIEFSGCVHTPYRGNWNWHVCVLFFIVCAVSFAYRQIKCLHRVTHTVYLELNSVSKDGTTMLSVTSHHTP